MIDITATSTTTKAGDFFVWPEEHEEGDCGGSTNARANGFYLWIAATKPKILKRKHIPCERNGGH